MIHSNPLQKGEAAGKRFITMGEIMLRLTPPNYDKIRMAPDSPLRDSLRILNPLGEDTSIMRTTILPPCWRS